MYTGYGRERTLRKKKVENQRKGLTIAWSHGILSNVVAAVERVTGMEADGGLQKRLKKVEKSS